MTRNLRQQDIEAAGLTSAAVRKISEQFMLILSSYFLWSPGPTLENSATHFLRYCSLTTDNLFKKRPWGVLGDLSLTWFQILSSGRWPSQLLYLLHKVSNILLSVLGYVLPYFTLLFFLWLYFFFLFQTVKLLCRCLLLSAPHLLVDYNLLLWIVSQNSEELRS